MYSFIKNKEERNENEAHITWISSRLQNQPPLFSVPCKILYLVKNIEPHRSEYWAVHQPLSVLHWGPLAKIGPATDTVQIKRANNQSNETQMKIKFR